MEHRKFISAKSQSKNSKVKGLIPLIVIIAITLTAGFILLVSKVLPEEQVKNFNALDEISLKTNLKVIKTPTPDDNTFIYALNPVAEEALHIAQNDTKVKQIINEQKGKAITIAAIQPTSVMESKDGKVSYSSTGPGQIIITSNWQYVNGKFYSNTANFNELDNKTGESRQHIWNVFVDLGKRTVTGISEEPERVMKETLQPNLIYTGMNMFMPDTIKVSTGSSIIWSNNSNLPHNIVGTYKKNADGSSVAVDSGFIQPNESWRYNFNDPGIFEYICTIHSTDGMKGTILVSSPTTVTTTSGTK
jgi:plastocyanin